MILTSNTFILGRAEVKKPGAYFLSYNILNDHLNSAQNTIHGWKLHSFKKNKALMASERMYSKSLSK